MNADLNSNSEVERLSPINSWLKGNIVQSSPGEEMIEVQEITKRTETEARNDIVI